MFNFCPPFKVNLKRLKAAFLIKTEGADLIITPFFDLLMIYQSFGKK